MIQRSSFWLQSTSERRHLPSRLGCGLQVGQDSCKQNSLGHGLGGFFINSGDPKIPKITEYSHDLNTEHLKTGNIRKPDVLMSNFQMVLVDHSKNGRFT